MRTIYFLIFIESLVASASRGGEGPLPVPALLSDLVLEQKWHANKDPVSEVLWFEKTGKVGSFAGKFLGSPKGLSHPDSGMAPVEREDKVYLYPYGTFLVLPAWVTPLRVSARLDNQFRGIARKNETQFLTYRFYEQKNEFFLEEQCQTPPMKTLRVVEAGDGRERFYDENTGDIFELTDRCDWNKIFTIPIKFQLQVQGVTYFSKGVVVEHTARQLWFGTDLMYVIPEVYGQAFVVDDELPAWISNTVDGGVALVLPKERRVIRIFDRGTVRSKQQVAYSKVDQTLYFAGAIHPESPYGIHSIKLDLSEF